MNVEAEDLIASLKAQRNANADEAAMLKAALDGAQRRIAELEAENAELKKPKE